MATIVRPRREIQALWVSIQMLTTEEHSRKFAYAIARNRSKLRAIVQDIAETTRNLPDFEEKKTALAKEMAKKDSEGNPIMAPNNQGYFVPDMVTFNEKLEVIRKETGQDVRDKENEKVLEEKEEVEVYMVPFDMVPESIRPDILEGLLPMIADPKDTDE